MSLPLIDTGLLLSHSMTALPVLLARGKGTLAIQQPWQSTLNIPRTFFLMRVFVSDLFTKECDALFPLSFLKWCVLITPRKDFTDSKKKLRVISAVSWIAFSWHAWLAAAYWRRANRDCRPSTVHRGTHTHTHFLFFKLSPSHPHTLISVSLFHLVINPSIYRD